MIASKNASSNLKRWTKAFKKSLIDARWSTAHCFSCQSRRNKDATQGQNIVTSSAKNDGNNTIQTACQNAPAAVYINPVLSKKTREWRNGRRARFRILWAKPMGVRVPLPAPLFFHRNHRLHHNLTLYHPRVPPGSVLSLCNFDGRQVISPDHFRPENHPADHLLTKGWRFFFRFSQQLM